VSLPLKQIPHWRNKQNTTSTNTNQQPKKKRTQQDKNVLQQQQQQPRPFSQHIIRTPTPSSSHQISQTPIIYKYMCNQAKHERSFFTGNEIANTLFVSLRNSVSAIGENPINNNKTQAIYLRFPMKSFFAKYTHSHTMKSGISSSNHFF